MIQFQDIILHVPHPTKPEPKTIVKMRFLPLKRKIGLDAAF